MEAAIRCSPANTDRFDRFLLVDLAENSITLNSVNAGNQQDVSRKVIARYDRVPNFTAFDWSRSDTSLLALGLSSGDVSLVKILSEQHSIAPVRTLPIRTPRKCNSITFNSENLLAVGLDRLRNDHCLTVYDVADGKEAQTRLCAGEAITSVKFLPSQPQQLVAAVARTTLKVFDLRGLSVLSLPVKVK